MEILNNNEIIHLTQGNDFDGYDERENNKNRLCNVKSESMKKVKSPNTYLFAFQKIL